ncbi:MAG: flavodoxin-dependent (E)-4-hydroxy-3-methylbut-2-enyl-diphosphate synthase [Deltaproteobacteria bacterium]|nr:flavodoxin-dependent (E)-4-hydroxy-3-methylbut-2-enyl-diphosphate synthase [Deltaproteobacteria bacterium]MBW2122532.1 flavodoxin-dependent (E)-4-hydroxy-3-methylbut-2-enyl-diphosphate synthase [Deltaproteobacteria bacterium]
MQRRMTRQISVGRVKIGGGAPISVQSMTKTDTRDVGATVSQIRRLEAAGCDLVRIAVVDREACEALASIKRATEVPLIADIHFDHRLALKALDAGVDGLRINPGNIGGREKTRAVVEAARQRGVPIRIGVNAGSLEKDILSKYGHPTAQAMVESCLRHIRILEDLDFYDMKVSVKASSVMRTIEAYRMLSERTDYPLHLGVTEAGPSPVGSVKSAVGLGILLEEGIGDTIRVSLTGDPVEEVQTGQAILRSLNLRNRGVDLVSCPTCGRCNTDVVRVALEVEERLRGIAAPLRVAVMGCEVNGPGEAREADVGVAFGKRWGILLKRGRIVRRYPRSRVVEALVAEVEEMARKAKGSTEESG